METYYTNPLVDDDYPDPSVIGVKGAGYFAYATHDTFSPTLNNILVRHSWDLIHWTEAKGALVSLPVWARTCKRFWCPQVIKFRDEFRLYYAAEPDTKDGMCLALAVSPYPNFFYDTGKPLSRIPGSTYQMIDPCVFIDPVSNRNLLYYGSAHEPIRVVELAADGITFISEPLAILYPGTGPFQQLREGAFVTYNATWKRYFLWVSGNDTWGENSYAVSLFWSDSPTGLFKKIPAEHIILQSNARWDSPGQNCILSDAAGNEWIVYHAVDKTDRFIAGTNKFLRKMCMDQVCYTSDGWPYVANNSPATDSQPAPVTR